MAAGTTDELATARSDFEASLERVRTDLRTQLGLSWRSVGFGALLLAAALGFGLARRLRDRRRSDVRREDA